MGDAFKTSEDLREAIRGELAAINDYEKFAARTEFPQIRELFRDTANDERVHVAEFFRALLMLDPDQARAYKEVFGGAR